ncbi:hypothetical protein DFH06DRAFT_1145905 [Mycena polygramma]|nr:hypothetical protein DFH06DRAFT_1145905 [Mycena polygramma]
MTHTREKKKEESICNTHRREIEPGLTIPKKSSCLSNCSTIGVNPEPLRKQTAWRVSCVSFVAFGIPYGIIWENKILFSSPHAPGGIDPRLTDVVMDETDYT